MADLEGIRIRKKKKNRNWKSRIKMILAIILGIVAFIIIITAAWKEQLLNVTSGKINNNQIKYVAKIGTRI